jgi:tRNA (guanine-N7-)-methyltransferase
MGEDRSRPGDHLRDEVKEKSPPRHQFYGRRKGHALRAHHARLVEELLPRLRVEPAQPASRGRETWLEIGFGGGEHLAHQAALHRDVHFIGAEPFVNGVAKLLAEIETNKLDNIRIHDGDVRDLLGNLPPSVLDRILLLYPDPWPKARHHKRRLVNQPTLAQFHRLLKPRGLFLFASDWPDYVEWTRAEVSAHGGFVEEGDAARPFEDWIETRYEAKARREGRVTAYLMFRKST